MARKVDPRVRRALKPPEPPRKRLLDGQPVEKPKRRLFRERLPLVPLVPREARVFPKRKKLIGR